MSDSSERVSELFKIGREQQSKFTYFLLALTAASIAFAVQITKDESLQAIHVILASSVILWLLSFFAGIQYLRIGMSLTSANQEYLQVYVDVASGRRETDLEAHLYRDSLQKITGELSLRSGKWSKYQILSLYFGAITFIVWHIAQMADAT